MLAARLSAALFVTQDDSLASLLLNRGVNVRDFIFLSILSDQGSASNKELARVLGIELEKVLQSLKRLFAAGLVLNDPESVIPQREPLASLTSRGRVIVRRIKTMGSEYISDVS